MNKIKEHHNLERQMATDRYFWLKEPFHKEQG